MKVLVIFLLLTLSGWAQTIKIESFLVRIPAGNRELASAHSLDSAEWERAAGSGQLQILDSGMAVGREGQPIGAIMGHKIPIPYYDPRVEDSQVQYVDSGFKFETRPRLVKPGVYRVDARLEQRFDTSSPKATRPDQVGLVTQTETLLRTGQVFILGKTRGHMTSQFLKQAYPNVTIGENDTVALCLRITGP